jgi:protocatechuate 3,4-dioxygenase alpha subunit
MTLEPTPAQTIGPFYGYALPFAAGGEIAPVGHPDTIIVHGYVYDGSGAPIPDALLEFWHGAPGAPGSLRHDPVSGKAVGRHGLDFTGFGRVPTDADGHYLVRTLPAPYISVCVFARGLLHHLFTRIYLREGDAFLDTLEPERRATLIATPERDRVYRFDIRVQGGPHEETVFLEFPASAGEP